MHDQIEALRNEVQVIGDVGGAALAFVRGLSGRVLAAIDGGDVGGARDMLKQSLDAAPTLASAITANTAAAGIAEPLGNANPSPGLPGPPADQAPETANPVSPDAVPQATGINATPAEARSTEGLDLPPKTAPGTPAIG